MISYNYKIKGRKFFWLVSLIMSIIFLIASIFLILSAYTNIFWPARGTTAPLAMLALIVLVPTLAILGSYLAFIPYSVRFEVLETGIVVRRAVRAIHIRWTDITSLTRIEKDEVETNGGTFRQVLIEVKIRGGSSFSFSDEISGFHELVETLKRKTGLKLSVSPQKAQVLHPD
jgi:hypothetical protein